MKSVAQCNATDFMWWVFRKLGPNLSVQIFENVEFINYPLNLGAIFITQISKLNLNVTFLIPLRTDVQGHAKDL